MSVLPSPPQSSPGGVPRATPPPTRTHSQESSNWDYTARTPTNPTAPNLTQQHSSPSTTAPSQQRSHSSRSRGAERPVSDLQITQHQQQTDQRKRRVMSLYDNAPQYSNPVITSTTTLTSTALPSSTNSPVSPRGNGSSSGASSDPSHAHQQQKILQLKQNFKKLAENSSPLPTTNNNTKTNTLTLSHLETQWDSFLKSPMFSPLDFCEISQYRDEALAKEKQRELDERAERMGFGKSPLPRSSSSLETEISLSPLSLASPSSLSLTPEVVRELVELVVLRKPHLPSTFMSSKASSSSSPLSSPSFSSPSTPPLGPKPLYTLKLLIANQIKSTLLETCEISPVQPLITFFSEKQPSYSPSSSPSPSPSPSLSPSSSPSPSPSSRSQTSNKNPAKKLDDLMVSFFEKDLSHYSGEKFSKLAKLVFRLELGPGVGGNKGKKKKEGIKEEVGEKRNFP
eukprot:CAMPEP_0201518498 /NCGR_PEP_ID=MMETSP0161_2-20130828/9334_1 /ASSEMBLY_ACC=CAM_ASM_000251 /TAXON_ID=180227 /ORGANISM="Neoparamoeba aestuarina, Strain SoJaBio B1-5/56/2" /LENGTH=454 /DNA_ID=CAMNT_0047916291 /DNA_START=390 /DNA_END=1751 /DNA_ORIENTATION=+